MGRQTTRDVTFVLRVWQEPDDDEPRARLLTTAGDGEGTAVGTADILRLVESAITGFLGRG